MSKIIKVRLTEYYPFQAGLTEGQQRVEGGVFDRLGKPLYALEDYLEGKAPYVSLACDSQGGPPASAAEFRKYGTKVWLPELSADIASYVDKVPMLPIMIPFQLVDTGGNFHGDSKVVKVAGYEPIDVCRRNKPAIDHSFSGKLTMLWIGSLADLMKP